MDYIGLVFKYPVNRPLAEFERELQLDQKIRLKVEPFYQLNIIKINTHFLETVDKFYAWNGALASFILTPILMALYANLFVLFDTIIQSFVGKADFEMWLACMATIVMMYIFIHWLSKLLFKELFAFTHYPIRLNRKNRMIYVFRTNGTVLTVPWDEVFFTLGMAGGSGVIQNWDLRGHVLAKDRNTVLESFAFGMVSNRKEDLFQLWEFIRRYMEEGPENLHKQVEFCMPVWDRRESWFFGLKRLLVNFNGLFLLQILMFPFLFLFSIGRFIAMRTSRIPQWPKEVEDACRIEPGDPYAKDWRSNKA